MTKAQERAVKFLRRDAAANLLFNEKHEFKEFDVKETDGGTLMVAIEAGYVGDEGTWASVFCRDRCIVFVGVRGAIWYYVDTKRKSKNGFRRVKYTGIWGACRDYAKSVSGR